MLHWSLLLAASLGLVTLALTESLSTAGPMTWCLVIVAACSLLLMSVDRRFRRLESRFGREVAERICRQEIWIGASEEFVTLSLGVPNEVQENVVDGQTQRTFTYRSWFYAKKGVAVFRDNTCVSWNPEPPSKPKPVLAEGADTPQRVLRALKKLELSGEARAGTLSWQPLDLTVRIIPNRQRQVQIPSFGDEGVSYSVDLVDQSCTCEGWSSRREMPTDNTARWCRHIRKAVVGSNLLATDDEWVRAIVHEGFEGPHRAWKIHLSTAGPVVLAVTYGNLWIDVFARSKLRGERIDQASGPIARYGWHLSGTRWSYGSGPPGSGELRRLLLRL
jgi:hypothetical protein